MHLNFLFRSDKEKSSSNSSIGWCSTKVDINRYHITGPSDDKWVCHTYEILYSNIIFYSAMWDSVTKAVIQISEYFTIVQHRRKDPDMF